MKRAVFSTAKRKLSLSDTFKNEFARRSKVLFHRYSTTALCGTSKTKNRKSWNHCGFRTFTGPSGETWTHDPLTPSQVRYQLRYTRMFYCVTSCRSQLVYISMPFKKKQPLNLNFLKIFEKLFPGQNREILLTNSWEIWYHTSSVRETDNLRTMERCPSGWRNRSWKPAMRKHPWVRIPLSPPNLLLLISPISSYAEVPKRPKGLPC